MKPRVEIKSFLDVLLLGSAPSKTLLAAFFLGLIIIGILSNLAYDLLLTPQDTAQLSWRPLLASLLLFIIAYALFQQDRHWRLRKMQIEVDESRLAKPHQGLIWLLGPNYTPLLPVLQHHLKGSGAKICWLIMQEDNPAVHNAYIKLNEWVKEEAWKTRVLPVYISDIDAKSTYRAAYTIFTRESAEEGISADQVIADITGGTKPMTAGLLLAALSANGDLEYVESTRDEQGQVIQGSQRVVMVDTKFYLTASE